MNNQIYTISWQYFRQKLKSDLNYSDAMIKRYQSNFNWLLKQYFFRCSTKSNNLDFEQCNQLLITDYENKNISRDKFLRTRRLLFHLEQYHHSGKITLKKLHSIDKRFANPENEKILRSFLKEDKKVHATSIVYRNEGIIRQFLLYMEDFKSNYLSLTENIILNFMKYMNSKRPAGLKTIISSLKYFIHYLYQNGIIEKDFSYVLKIKSHEHHKIYGIFSAEEKEAILRSIDRSNVLGKRDYAIFRLACCTGLRSSDISSLKLTDIDWIHSCITISQKKTGKPIMLPIDRETGNALAEYILYGRSKADNSYVFQKKTYTDSSMTSALLCHTLKKYMKLANVAHPESDKMNMHTFRRNLGTNLLETGSNLELISQVLGHTNNESTRIYLSYSEQKLLECALDLTDLPTLWEVR